MASITMTASLLGGVGVCKRPSVPHRRAVMAKAMKTEVTAKLNCDDAEKRAANGRRDVMFAAAAAAVCCIVSGQGNAMAEEPKPGTPEAKKLYAPVCVTMPTARICRK